MNSGHDRHPSSEGSRPHRSGVNQTFSSPDRWNPDWYLRRGALRAGRGEHESAETDFLRAAELAPSSPVPWRNLALLYQLMGTETAAVAAELEAESRLP